MSNQKISKITDLESPSTISDKFFIQSLAKWCRYTKLDIIIDTKELDKKFKHVYEVPTLVGVEIEVEGLKSEVPLPDFWNGKGDGSLRGVSAEFFSVPLTPKQVFYATSFLYSAMKKFAPRSLNFSWRTSIQDHFNLLELDEEGLKKLLILSMMMEKLMFKFVGGERNQSVFCVPLTESTTVHYLAKYIQNKISLKTLVSEKWPKYSSINLRRLFSLDGVPGIGTIEFRHLGGTKNLPLVLCWHSLLLQLYQASIKYSLDQLYDIIRELPSSKQYASFVTSVFSPEIVKYFNKEDFPSLMAHPISKTKELFIETPKLEGVKPKSTLAAYAAYIQKKTKKTAQPGVTIFETIPPALDDIITISITNTSTNGGF